MANFPAIDGYEHLNKQLQEYVDALAKTSCFANLPLISVGSGSALIENYLVKHTDVKEVICVDPDPGSYGEDPVLIKPKYARVDELIDAEPDLIGNCVLMIIKCNPMMKYDIEAINKLRPRMMFLMYRSDGADGGHAFHYFLESNVFGDIPHKNQYCKSMGQDPQEDEYRNEIPFDLLYHANEIHHSHLIREGTDARIPTCAILYRGEKLINYHVDLKEQLVTGEINPDAPTLEELDKAIIHSCLNPAACTLM
tara:strand:+ start:44716 stop:45474 length:759 start_codon:yes stop_codon:yes gene_type:complete